MKTLLLAGIISGTMFLSGCTAVSPQSNQPVPMNSYNRTVSLDYDINLTFYKNYIQADMKNNSDKLIFVDWSEIVYTGLDEVPQRAFDMNHKNEGIFAKAIDGGVRPSETLSAKFVPMNNLKVIFGSGSDTQTIFIESDLFKKEISKKKREYAELKIPVSVGGFQGYQADASFIFSPALIPEDAKSLIKLEEKQQLDKNVAEKEALLKQLQQKEAEIKRLKEQLAK